MKGSGKKIVSIIFVVLLTIFVVIMEFALRFAEPFSPTSYRYIQRLFKNHPYIFGSLWIVIMVSGVYVAYRKFTEQKTKSRLAELLIWLTIFFIILIYGLYHIF
jgi:tryptophan-rich sensory protein